MSLQLSISFDITHQRENSPLNEAHLNEYRDKFNADCFRVLERLVKGERLMQLQAGMEHLSGDLRARIRDLRNPNYGFGIPISDCWVKTGKSKSKEYFMTESDKCAALQILLSKMKKVA